MRVLVVNAGSSSLKLRVLGPGDEVEVAHDVADWGDTSEEADLRELLASLPPVDAVGHRVVHGGSRFHSAVRVDASVEREIEALVPLAPLHQPACAGRHPAPRAAGARRAADRVLRHRFPRDAARRRGDLRVARQFGGSAGTFAGSASTGSRTRTRRDAPPS